MAATTSAPTGNMSDAIREYLKAHPDASQKDVAEGLSAQGVKVSASLINKIKYNKPKPGRKRKAGRAAGSRNGAAGTSKAQSIRDAFATLGRTARPRDIMAHLRQQGTVVSAAQVSVMRKGLGKRGRKAAGRKAGGSVAAGGAAAGSHGGDTGISLQHLLAAKKLADQVGMPAARKALEVLAKLGSP